MRYLVRAKLKPGREEDLFDAVEDGTIGWGSIAYGEYERNMRQAKLCEDGTVRWVEVCYCPRPLMEEIPYWEAYFDLVKIMDAHDRQRCRDWNGEEAWACSSCDCTDRLEEHMETWGDSFLAKLGEKFFGRVVDVLGKGPMTAT